MFLYEPESAGELREFERSCHSRTRPVRWGETGHHGCCLAVCFVIHLTSQTGDNKLGRVVPPDSRKDCFAIEISSMLNSLFPRQ